MGLELTAVDDDIHSWFIRDSKGNKVYIGDKVIKKVGLWANVPREVIGFSIYDGKKCAVFEASDEALSENIEKVYDKDSKEQILKELEIHLGKEKAEQYFDEIYELGMKHSTA